MTQPEHKKRHLALHEAYDELIADYLRWNPDRLLSNTNLVELLEWSFAQTATPTDDGTGLRTVHTYNVCAHCGRSVNEPIHRCLTPAGEAVRS